VVKARLVMSKKSFYELAKILADTAADFQAMEKHQGEKK
jgi:hypothetical protein